MGASAFMGIAPRKNRAGLARDSLHLFLEVAAPALWQSLQLHGLLQRLTIVCLKSVQPENLSNREAVFVTSDQLDGVSAINLAFLSDCKIEACAPAIQEALDHLRPSEPDS